MLIALALRLVSLVFYILLIVLVQVFTLLFAPFQMCKRRKVERVKADELAKFLSCNDQVMVEFNGPIWSRISGTSMLMSFIFSSLASSDDEYVLVRCCDMRLADVQHLVNTTELFWLPCFASFQHGKLLACSKANSYTMQEDLRGLMNGTSKHADLHPWKIGSCGGP